MKRLDDEARNALLSKYRELVKKSWQQAPATGIYAEEGRQEDAMWAGTLSGFRAACMVVGISEEELRQINAEHAFCSAHNGHECCGVVCAVCAGP